MAYIQNGTVLRCKKKVEMLQSATKVYGREEYCPKENKSKGEMQKYL